MPAPGPMAIDGAAAIAAAMTPPGQVATLILPGDTAWDEGTGPVAVRGAKKGQTLQVDIEKIDFAYDWGFNNIMPLRGALPDDFAEEKIIHIALDAGSMVGTLPWGMEVPLKPFFGVMAVAPPAAWGTLSTIPPRRNGGNIDNKDVAAGTTLYMPIYVAGALFSVGDGHAAQGHGEVDLSAIETGLRGKFQFVVRRDMKITWPRAETATHWIVMGLNPNLEEAMRIAVRETIVFITQRFPKLSREEAYMIASVAVDYHVTQVVDGTKGIHGMIPKSIFVGQ